MHERDADWDRNAAEHVARLIESLDSFAPRIRRRFRLVLVADLSDGGRVLIDNEDNDLNELLDAL